MPLKYMTIVNSLKKEIAQRGPLGERRLPTEAELARTYGVSRQTVRQALSVLLAEGIIEKRQGSGSYIAPSVFPKAASSKKIAFLVPDVASYQMSREIGDAQSVLSASDYSFQVYNTENRTAKERDILRLFLTSPVRGLLVHGVRTAFPNPNYALYEELIARGTSVVFLGDALPEVNGAYQITLDDRAGGALLARHLISLGHKKIAGIFRLDNLNGHKQYAGVLQALCENSLSFDDRNFLWYDPLAGQIPDSKMLLSFIRIQLADCTAVICQNLTVAEQLIHEMQRLEIQIPQRVSVAAFDVCGQSRQDSMHLTRAVSVDAAPWKIAVDILLDKIEGRSAASATCSWSLCPGDSTAPPEQKYTVSNPLTRSVPL